MCVCVCVCVCVRVWMSSNNSSGAGMGGRGLCDLTQSYSFILQSVLGVLAFSTLIRELHANTCGA